LGLKVKKSLQNEGLSMRFLITNKKESIPNGIATNGGYYPFLNGFFPLDSLQKMNL
jgi:hypothetical protein